MSSTGMEKHVSSGDSIRFGWQATKDNVEVVAGGLLLEIGLTLLPNLLGFFFSNTIIQLFFSIVASVMSMVIGLGLQKVALMVYDGKKPQFSDLWSVVGYVPAVIVGSILYALIVLGGHLLLLIPGMIWLIRFNLVTWAILDKGTGPIAGLKESHRLSQGGFWTIAAFLSVMLLFNLAGLLALGVGVLVTIAITPFCFAYLYRKLQGREPGTAALTMTRAPVLSDSEQPIVPS